MRLEKYLAILKLLLMVDVMHMSLISTIIILRIEFTIMQQHCYAYVSNINDYHPKNRIHNHATTCSVNGVYYLNVPSEQSGMISFYNDNDEQVYTYQPKAFDLLIMPNFMKHYPHKSLVEEYRVSINIEIFIENWSNHYSHWYKNNFTK